MASSENENFELLTTTRYDPYLKSLEWNADDDGPSPFLLLPYHRDRLSVAADEHKWKIAKASLTYQKLKIVCLEAICQSEEPSHRVMLNLSPFFASVNVFVIKVRITLSRSGKLAVTTTPMPPLTSDPTILPIPRNIQDKSIGTILLHLDQESTPSSLFTITKTTNRRIYDEARQRNHLPSLPSPTEVLLYNPEQLITETTIFNVALYRSSGWITPALSSGCLPGVMRRWLLEEGRIREDHEGILTRSIVKEGELILLFNGAQGCRLGRIGDPHERLF
jgi:4-amino-4-deoxychorismate lyase